MWDGCGVDKGIVVCGVVCRILSLAACCGRWAVSSVGMGIKSSVGGRRQLSIFMREGTIVFFHESGCVVLVDRGEGGCGGSKVDCGYEDEACCV